MNDSVLDRQQTFREVQRHFPVAVRADIQGAVCVQTVAVAQGGANPCQQFGSTERFGDVVVRT